MAASELDKHAFTRRKIELWSGPAKASEIDWAAASDPTQKYNCFGFALGNLAWWEPYIVEDGVRLNEGAVWPSDSPSVTIEAYVDAAKTEGFLESQDSAWEEGFETIMLYFTERDREFRHAAKHVSPGIWASKMGTGSDITHAIDGVDRIEWGYGRVYMKRPWPWRGQLFSQLG